MPKSEKKRGKKQYKTKIEVTTSKAFRRDKHERDPSEVDTSDPFRIPKHTRNKRRTKNEVGKVVTKFNESGKIPRTLRDQRVLQRRNLISISAKPLRENGKTRPVPRRKLGKVKGKKIKIPEASTIK